MEMKEKENEKDARRVLLSVTGLAKNQEAEDEAVHLLTTGTLFGRLDAWRLDYVETQPDSQESAVTLTLGGGVVTMQRRGDFATSMVFEKGCRFEGSYDTPYGSLDMGVFPTLVRYCVDEEANGEVKLKYQLDLQGQFAAMHELRIRFCPAGKA